MTMKTYIVQFKLDGERRWETWGSTKARSAAGAIKQALCGMQDIEGTLIVAATVQRSGE
jgi:hypothetical protein